MTIRGSAWVAVALVAGIGATACNRQESATLEPVPERAVPFDESRSDAELATDVQGRFYADDMIRAGRIDVEAESGVVTLSGTAQSEEARQRALEVARSVPGVTQVEDELRVAETTRAGAQASAAGGARQGGSAAESSGATGQLPTPSVITTNIQAQYFSNPAVRQSNIEVNARPGGVVELRGEVADVQAKNEAVRIARDVDGVVRVDDQLRIRAESQQQQAAATTGAASQGAAATTGAATGEAAASGSAADVDGTRTTGIGDDISDAWLTAKVQSKYYLDDAIRGRDIDVTTQNSVVTLTGTVQSAQERRQAVALARNTEGVTDVRDQLQVTQTAATAGAQQPQARAAASGIAARIEDGWITTKIQSQYFLDSEVKGHEINVDTRNGVVTLKGSVASDQQKQLAAQIARETEGVTSVTNQLTISP